MFKVKILTVHKVKVQQGEHPCVLTDGCSGLRCFYSDTITPRNTIAAPLKAG